MTSRHRPAPAPILLAVICLAVGACSPSAPTSPSTTESEPTTTTTSTTIPTTTTTTEQDFALDVQAEIDWFVSLLNGAGLSEEEYRSRFTEEFRRQVPYDEGFVPVLEQFRPQGPFTVIDRSGEGARGVAVIESSAGSRARVVADLDDQGRFAALTIQPADTPSLEDPPETIEEALRRLGDIGVLRALAAEVRADRCVAIEAVDAGEPAPIGSGFKLYVLAALGEAIEVGDVAWGDEIVIRDELKSVPTGVLQNRDAGDTVTVREAAELMISISDNTATDHLIDLLGRKRVEAAFADYGNTTPELNTPLLGTRELTALKIGPASGLRLQWLDGNEETRRDLLAQISDITPGDLPVEEWDEPIEPDRLEWFASPDDLCTLAIRLDQLAQQVPEVGRILTINPGVPAEPGTWDSIWFKGGSEPGLAAMWFVTCAGSRTFVTTGSVVDADAPVDAEQVALLFAATRDLLAP